MNGQELPPFYVDAPVAEPATPEVQSGLLKKETVQKMHLLRDVLINHRMPDVATHCFSFHGERLEDDSIFMPEIIHKLEVEYGALDSIDVQLYYLHGSGGVTYDVTFEFYEEDSGESTYLLASRPYNYQANDNNTDEIYQDDEETIIAKIEAIQMRDLTRCLTSLLYSSPTIPTSALDAFDWNKNDYMDSVNRFKKTAKTTSSNEEYIFSDDLGGPSGSLSFEVVDGKVTDTRIYRLKEQEVDMSPEGNFGYVERAFELSVDYEDETLCCEYIIIDENKPAAKMLLEDDIDYRATVEFLDAQLAPLDSLPLN